MKILFFLVGCLVLVNLHAQEYAVSIEKSHVEWKAYKVTGSHTGTIDLLNATVDINKDGELIGGAFSINMNSILVTDLGGNGKEKLENHLRSNDFFDTESFPVANLVITDVKPGRKDSEVKIVANLTIKEITAPFVFYAIQNEKELTAKMEIDRSIYDVQYGSGSFFDNLGNRLIYDLFELEVTLVVE